MLWDDAEYNKESPVKLVKDEKIRRVVLCTGKVYYDLLEEREKRGTDDIYLMRIEQLYPFPAKALVNELVAFQGCRDRMVSGRAAEHGGMDIHPALHGMGSEPD